MAYTKLKCAPYLHQKSNNWGLNMSIFKYVCADDALEGAVLASIFKSRCKSCMKYNPNWSKIAIKNIFANV